MEMNALLVGQPAKGREKIKVSLTNEAIDIHKQRGGRGPIVKFISRDTLKFQRGGEARKMAMSFCEILWLDERKNGWWKHLVKNQSEIVLRNHPDYEQLICQYSSHLIIRSLENSKFGYRKGLFYITSSSMQIVEKFRQCCLQKWFKNDRKLYFRTRLMIDSVSRKKMLKLLKGLQRKKNI